LTITKSENLLCGFGFRTREGFINIIAEEGYGKKFNKDTFTITVVLPYEGQEDHVNTDMSVGVRC